MEIDAPGRMLIAGPNPASKIAEYDAQMFSKKTESSTILILQEHNLCPLRRKR
jgi:hypothetical protein